MQSIYYALDIWQSRSTLFEVTLTTCKSVIRKVMAICLAVIMATAPITGAIADSGFMKMQLEFGISKKPSFRQLNITYQNYSGFGEKQSFHHGETTSPPGINIPLFSMGARSPGLINLLYSVKPD